MNLQLKDFFNSEGFKVPMMGSFHEEDDNRVEIIPPQSIEKVVLDLGSLTEVDTNFVSCTNFRIASEVQLIERKMGKPVTSSNHAIAWHALCLAGIKENRHQWVYTV